MLSMRNRLREMLIKHEGLKLKAYRCPAGKITIGVGRNLEDLGISKDEALLMLTNDIERVTTQAYQAFPWFVCIGVVRQDVVLSMIFNLGLEGFKGFKRLIAALQNADYERAANEMLLSKWSAQVGPRALELSQMMRTGIYV